MTEVVLPCQSRDAQGRLSAMVKGELKSKLSETLSELESALKAWDEAKWEKSECDNEASTAACSERSQPLYERALLKKIYKQLQELSEE